MHKEFRCTFCQRNKFRFCRNRPPSTKIKIEVLDTEGNPLFVQPGEGIPEYYEGLSKLITVHVYEDTPIGIGKITILGELEKWVDENGFPVDATRIVNIPRSEDEGFLEKVVTEKENTQGWEIFYHLLQIYYLKR